jgi:hypothetical protein
MLRIRMALTENRDIEGAILAALRVLIAGLFRSGMCLHLGLSNLVFLFLPGIPPHGEIRVEVQPAPRSRVSEVHGPRL